MAGYFNPFTAEPRNAESEYSPFVNGPRRSKVATPGNFLDSEITAWNQRKADAERYRTGVSQQIDDFLNAEGADLFEKDEKGKVRIEPMPQADGTVLEAPVPRLGLQIDALRKRSQQKAGALRAAFSTLETGDLTPDAKAAQVELAQIEPMYKAKLARYQRLKDEHDRAERMKNDAELKLGDMSRQRLQGITVSPEEVLQAIDTVNAGRPDGQSVSLDNLEAPTPRPFVAAPAQRQPAISELVDQQNQEKAWRKANTVTHAPGSPAGAPVMLTSQELQARAQKRAANGVDPRSARLLELQTARDAGVSAIDGRPISDVINENGGDGAVATAATLDTMRRLNFRIQTIDKALEKADPKSATRLTNERAVLEELAKKKQSLIDQIPTGTRIESALGTLVSGFAEIPAGTLDFVAIAAKKLDQEMPGWMRAYDGKNVDELQTAQWAGKIREIATQLAPSDPRLQNEFWTTSVPNAVGSMIGFILPTTAGKTRLTRAVITMVLGGAVGGSQGYKDAIAHGASEQDAFTSFLLNTGVGFSELVPIGRMFSRLEKLPGGNRLKRALIDGGIEAFEEAAQEWGQQVAGNKIAKELYDENRELLAGATDAAAPAGVAGALTSILFSALGGKRAPGTNQSPKLQPTPTAGGELSGQENKGQGTQVLNAPLPTPTAPAADQKTGSTGSNTSPSVPATEEEPTKTFEFVDPSGAPTQINATSLAAATAQLPKGYETRSVREILQGSSVAERQTHNLETAGSSPAPAPNSESATVQPARVSVDDEDAIEAAAAAQQQTTPVVKESSTTEAKPKFDKSSTQVTLPPGQAKPFVDYANTIPENDVYTDADIKGRETEPHITALYGIENDDAGPVRKALAGIGPITATLGNTSSFENADKPYDVLKVSVFSGDLKRVNAAVKKATKNSSDFPDYKPHLTIAYVKKGAAKKYINDGRFAGQQITFDTLQFRTRDGRSIDIPLTGAATETSRPTGLGVDQATDSGAAPTPSTPQEPATTGAGKPEPARTGVEGAATPAASSISQPPASASDQPQATSTTPEPGPAADSPEYKAFAKKYRDIYRQMMKYSPGETGSSYYAGKLAELSDKHPDWAERVESEKKTSAGTDTSPATGTTKPPTTASVNEPASPPATAPTPAATASSDAGAAAGPVVDTQSEKSDTTSDERARPESGGEPVGGIRTGQPDEPAQLPTGPGDSRTPDAMAAPGVDAGEGEPERVRGTTTAGQPGVGGRGDAGSGEPRQSGSGVGDTEPGAQDETPDVSEGTQPEVGTREGSGANARPERTRTELTPEQRNHFIAPDDTIVPGGDISKARANIAAIKLLRKLEGENRNATPEEKKILAQYVGWGGLPSVFDDGAASLRERKTSGRWLSPDQEQQLTGWSKKWGSLYDDVKKLLTEEEWNAAARSTINAHYTSREVISGMWEIAKRLGFDGGIAEETSAGIGHFVGLEPQDLAAKTRWKLIELDELSGRMLKKLYPQADVQITGFERAKMPAINEYFARKPEMMLGEMTLAGTMYRGDEPALIAKPGTELAGELKKVTSLLPEDIMGGTAARVVAPTAEGDTSQGKEGSVVVKDGAVYVTENGVLAKPAWSSTARKVEIAKSFTTLRDTLKGTIDTMLSESATDGLIAAMQKKLNAAYDRHVKRYGPVNNIAHGFLDSDPEFPLVQALENVGTKLVEKTVQSGKNKGQKRQTYEKVYEKAAIFSKRTLTPRAEPQTADTLSDAITQSLAYRNGIDLVYVAKLRGISEDDAKAQLRASDAVFTNPKSGQFETADAYLSGFVREKLDEAKAAAKDDPAFEKNVAALEKVQPAWLAMDSIAVRLGSSWLPERTIADFLKERLRVTAKVTYVQQTGHWSVEPSAGWTDAVNTTTYGTTRIPGHKLVEEALNLKQANIYDEFETPEGPRREKNPTETLIAQQKQSEIQDLFKQWMLDQKARHAELEKIYNTRFNGTTPRKFDGPQWDYYPNASTEKKPRPHQKKVVSRILQESTLLAHSVGTGKTMIMQTAAMEMRRLGMAKKPMLVTQNATTQQFAASFKQLYPTARLLVPTKREREASNRKKLISKIATGDYDAVIIPQSFLNQLPDDPKRVRSFIDAEIEELKRARIEASNAEGDRSPRVKDLVKAQRRLEEKLQKLTSRKVDDTVTFEQLGVDALFVDEAHAYKKLEFATQMENIKGLDKGASERGLGLYMKTRWIQEKNNGKNVVLATGTPVSNTIAEAWNMLRFTRPDLLKKYHVEKFDDFASTFGDTVTNLEQTAGGTFKSVTRFARYTNGPELIALFHAAADVVLKEDINLPGLPAVKNRQPTSITIPQTPKIKEYVVFLREKLAEFERMSGREKRENSHIPLVTFGLAKKATLDMRLIDPSFPDEPGSKLNRAVKEALRVYKDTADVSGAQLIFADLFQSPNGAFNLYHEFRNKLVAAGVPESEVVIIPEAKTDAQRERMFELLKTGAARFALGSTEKMGVGVNVQDKLVALHHLDAPHRPMDIEQRNGRIIRQGNTNAEVEIFNYGVENTLDATLYQRLAIKQKFINQIMRGDITGRSFEDAADEVSMTFEEQMAAFSGNPLAIKKVAAEGEVRRLEAMKQGFARQLSESKSRLRSSEQSIEEGKEYLTRLERAAFEFWETLRPDPYGTVDGKKYKDRKTLVEALDQYLKRELAEKKAEVGTSVSKNGFSFTVPGVSIYGTKLDLTLQIPTNEFGIVGEGARDPEFRYVADLGNEITEQGHVTTGDGLLRSFATKADALRSRIEWKKGDLARYQRDVTELSGFVKQPFQHQAALDKAIEELDQIEKELAKSAADEAKAAKPADTATQPGADAFKPPSEELQMSTPSGENSVDNGAPAAMVFRDVPREQQRPADQRVVDAFEQLINSKRAAGEPRVTLSIREPARLYSDSGASTGSLSVSAEGGTPEKVRERLEAAFGKRIVFVEPSAPVAWHAMTATGLANTVLINTRANSPFLALTGHEFTHNLQTQRADLYAKLRASVLELAPMPADYAGIKSGQGYAAEKIEDEWIADVVGERFDEPAFWREIQNSATTQGDKRAIGSLARAALNYLRRLGARIRNAFHESATEPFIREIEKVRKAIADVFVEYANEGPYFSNPESLAGDADYSKPVVKGSAAQEQVLSKRLGSLEDKRSIVQRTKALLDDTRDYIDTELKQKLVDRFASIKRLERAVLGNARIDASASAYKWARLTSNLPSVMEFVLLHGPIAYKAGSMIKRIERMIYDDGTVHEEFDAQGLLTIFRPLTESGKLRLWEGYVAAYRANRLMAEGKENNFKSQAEIDALLDLAKEHPEFETIRRKYVAFQRSVLDVAEAAGLVNQSQRGMWEKADYVPFYRIMDTMDGRESGAKGPYKRRGIANQRSGVRQLKGGESSVDIVENIYRNIETLIDASFKNVAMQRVADLAGTQNDLITKIPYQAVPFKTTVEEAKRLMESQGIDTSSISPDEWDNVLAFWRTRAPQGKDVVSVMKSGKAAFFRVKDAPLLRSILALGPDRHALWMRMLSGPRRLLTNFVTLDPAFMVANTVRDSFSAWVQADTPIKPGIDSAIGFVKSLRNDASKLAIMAAGGGSGHYNRLSQGEVRKQFARMTSDQRRTFVESVVDTPGKAWRLFKDLGRASENANRIAIYDSAKKRGASDAEAAFQALDIMDFGLRGDSKLMNFFFDTVPFLNARMQGLYRLGRGLKHNPARVATHGAIIVGATLALLALNWDDDRYWELQEWDRDTYYHLWLGGRHIRIPKPFEVGQVFSTVPERMFELVGKTGDVPLFFKRMLAMVRDTFAFNPIPQVLKPVAERAMNQNLFTGAPIISEGERYKLPEQQYNTRTSETIRELVKVMPDTAPEWLRSPKTLEHMIHGYFGTLGIQVLNGADALTRELAGYPDQPETKAGDFWLVGRFAPEDDVRATKYVSQFYDLHSEIMKLRQQAKALRERGDFTEAAQVEAENRDIMGFAARSESAYKTLQALRKRQTQIYESPTLDAPAKRSALEQLTTARNTIARQTIEASPRRARPFINPFDGN